MKIAALLALAATASVSTAQLAVPNITVDTLYVGTWTNTTFDSTGSVEFSVTLDEADRYVVSFDFGGFAFGTTDPDPFTLVFEPFGGDGVVADDLGFLGQIDATLRPDGTLSGSLTDAGGAGGFARVVGEAAFGADGSFSGSYAIFVTADDVTSGSAFAEGVFVAQAVPGPGAAAVSAGAGLALLRRRR